MSAWSQLVRWLSPPRRVPVTLAEYFNRPDLNRLYLSPVTTESDADDALVHAAAGYLKRDDAIRERRASCR